MSGILPGLFLFALCLLFLSAGTTLWAVYHHGEKLSGLRADTALGWRLHGQIASLNENLTHSAHLAVITEESVWRHRYMQSFPQLQDRAEQLRKLFKSLGTDTAAEELTITDALRSRLELRAFNLLDSGDAQMARELLNSSEYRDISAELHQNLDTVRDTLRRLDERTAAFSPQVLTAGGILLFSIVLAFLSGAAVLKERRRTLTGLKAETAHFRNQEVLSRARLKELEETGADITAAIERLTAENRDLLTQNHRFRSIVESMSDGLAVYSVSGDAEEFRFSWFNTAAERAENLTREDILGKSLREVFPAVDSFGLTDVLARVWRSGTPEHLPAAVYEDQRIRGWRDNFVFKLPSGEVAALYRDITELRRTEEALQQAEERSSRLYNSLPVMLHSVDSQGKIISVSDFWLEKTGFSREEVIGRSLRNFIPDNHRDYRLDEILPRLVREGGVFNVTCRVLTKEGGHIDALLSATSERNAEGEFRRSIAVITDISELHITKTALAESEERMMLALRGGNVGFWDWDITSDMLICDGQWAEIAGFDSEETVSVVQDWHERIHRDDLPPFLAGFQRVVRADTEFLEAEHRVLSASEEWRWALAIGRVSERNSRGEPLRVTGVLLDIDSRKRAEASLAASEERFRNVALTTGDWIWEVNTDGTYTYMSDTVSTSMGYAAEELIGKKAFELMPETESSRIEKIFADIVKRGERIVDLENWNIAKDGRRVCMLTNGVPIFDDAGRLSGYFGVDKDITARKNTEYKLQLFEKVFESALEGITITDADSNILAVNPAFTSITGYMPDEVLGHTPRLLKSDKHTDSFYREMWESLTTTGSWEGEIWNRRKSGEAYPEWLSISSILDDNAEVTQYVAVFHDISEIKRQQEHIRYQAHHDALTGLPNRTLLKDRLGMSLSRCRRADCKVAVLFIDIDNFKNINDSLGHPAGDKLLLAVAERFRAVTRESDSVARFGGDEFVIASDTVTAGYDAVHLAERIFQALEQPIPIDGRELYITASIGIALFPDDALDGENLLRCADTAMYQAKEAGRNSYRLFTPDMNERASERLALEHELRAALGTPDIFLAYQPRFDLSTGRMVGAEALARWKRADTVVSPGLFIPVAEETDIIIPLGRQILQTAVRDFRALPPGLPEDFVVSVNLSARQFRQPGIEDVITGILQFHGYPSSRLELEITESVLAEDISGCLKLLNKLVSTGIRFALDDFGTGYSSLAYLRNFPLATLKIDRSFVQGLGDNAGDDGIVRAIIALARNFGMRVVAEGVETESQLELLRRFGCDEVQGFLLGKPMPLEDLIRLAGASGSD